MTKLSYKSYSPPHITNKEGINERTNERTKRMNELPVVCDYQHCCYYRKKRDEWTSNERSFLCAEEQNMSDITVTNLESNMTRYL